VTILAPFLLALLPQGQVKPETRELEVLSASGKARVRVVNRSKVAPPGTLDACPFSGTATLSASVEGTPRWSVELTCAVHELRVLDDGRAAGIGFSEGPTVDFAFAHLFLLGADGRVVHEERVTEVALGRDGAGCVQPPLGILLDGAHERVVARLWRVDLKREEWRVWDARSGAPSRWMPAIQSDGALCFGSCSTAVELVPGTPFTLVQAWKPAGRAGLFHASYVLLDDAARVFWQLPVPEDHAERVDGAPLPAAPGILRTGARSFSVRLFTARQSVAFELVQGADQAWSVRETGRSALPTKP